MKNFLGLFKGKKAARQPAAVPAAESSDSVVSLSTSYSTLLFAQPHLR